MSLNEATKAKIGELISGNDVVLFMKGSPSFPQCGFSATVTQILSSLLPSYATVNVLADPDIRDGIKAYSSWPTIPQLYVRGEFVGGCDIVKELYASGELTALLGSAATTPVAPTLTVTDAAATSLKEALADADPGDFIHLSIDGSFATSLDVGPQKPGELKVDANGVTLLVDGATARRAEGVTIDFIEAGEAMGFRIDNPNAPAKVVELSPPELKAKLESGHIVELFDVRPPNERAMASIEGARLLDQATDSYIEGLDRDVPIAFHCHHGMRSRTAAEHFLAMGFKKVYNLAGGIDAWSTQVDQKVPRY